MPDKKLSQQWMGTQDIAERYRTYMTQYSDVLKVIAGEASIEALDHISEMLQSVFHTEYLNECLLKRAIDDAELDVFIQVYEALNINAAFEFIERSEDVQGASVDARKPLLDEVIEAGREDIAVFIAGRNDFAFSSSHDYNSNSSSFKPSQLVKAEEAGMEDLSYILTHKYDRAKQLAQQPLHGTTSQSMNARRP